MEENPPPRFAERYERFCCELKLSSAYSNRLLGRGMSLSVPDATCTVLTAQCDGGAANASCFGVHPVSPFPAFPSPSLTLRRQLSRIVSFYFIHLSFTSNSETIGRKRDSFVACPGRPKKFKITPCTMVQLFTQHHVLKQQRAATTAGSSCSFFCHTSTVVARFLLRQQLAIRQASKHPTRERDQDTVEESDCKQGPVQFRGQEKKS